MLKNKQKINAQFLVSKIIFEKPLLYIYLLFSAHFLFIFGISFDLHQFPYNFFDSKPK